MEKGRANSQAHSQFLKEISTAFQQSSPFSHWLASTTLSDAEPPATSYNGPVPAGWLNSPPGLSESPLNSVSICGDQGTKIDPGNMDQGSGGSQATSSGTWLTTSGRQGPFTTTPSPVDVQTNPLEPPSNSSEKNNWKFNVPMQHGTQIAAAEIDTTWMQQLKKLTMKEKTQNRKQQLPNTTRFRILKFARRICKCIFCTWTCSRQASPRHCILRMKCALENRR